MEADYNERLKRKVIEALADNSILNKEEQVKELMQTKYGYSFKADSDFDEELSDSPGKA